MLSGLCTCIYPGLQNGRLPKEHVTIFVSGITACIAPALEVHSQQAKRSGKLQGYVNAPAKVRIAKAKLADI
jgi:hypothetical protein